MKVAFDFDGTLSTPAVQKYCRELLEKGFDVWVVTTRFDINHRHKYDRHFPGEAWVAEINLMEDPNSDLWDVVDSLGIPRWKVRFTCMQDKWIYLHETVFAFHLDDNPQELSKARINNCSVPMVFVADSDWKEQCQQHIQNKQAAILAEIMEADQKLGLYDAQ